VNIYQANISIADLRDHPITNDAVSHLNEELRDALQNAMQAIVAQLEKDYRIALKLDEKR